MHSSDRTIQDYIAIVRRRILVVVLLCIIGAAIGVAFAKSQRITYRATAADVVNLQNLPNGIAGIQAPNLVNPDRYTATFAHLASSPDVAALAIQLSHVRGITPNQLLNESSASPDVNANYIRFTVTSRAAARSKTLVNGFASAFLYFLRTQSVQQTNALLANVVTEVRAMAARVAAARTTSSPLAPSLSQQYTALLTQQSQLKTLRAYQASQPVQVTTPATSASAVQPTVTTAGAAGLVGGLLVGILVAFGLEGLDKRVRTSEEIGEITGLPLLGRVPKRTRRQATAGVVSLQLDASSPEVDAYYAIAARLELVATANDAKVIGITSAIEAEGKSTAGTNLAVALASRGHHVTMIDLDLRRPSVASLFGRTPGLGVTKGPGVVEVAAGLVSLDDALQQVRIAAPAVETPGSNHGAGENGAAAASGEEIARGRPAHARGLLMVLTAGELPRDPARLTGQEAIRDIIETASAKSDYVIVDTAPLLAASDTLSILPLLHAVVFVARLGHVRSDMLAEAQRLLEDEPTIKVGAIATGTTLDHVYPGGYGYVPNVHGEREKVRPWT